MKTVNYIALYFQTRWN